MHIVMITNVVAPDKLGGLERYVRELSAELVRQGHSVSVVSKRTSAGQPLLESWADGVLVIRYDMPKKTDALFGLKYPFAAILGVSKGLRISKAQFGVPVPVIHGHFPVPMLLLALMRRPYVYTCHAPVYKELLDERQGSYILPKFLQRIIVKFLRLAEKIVVKRAVSVITLSDFIAREVSDLGAKPYDRVLRIPGGLDTTWFSPPESGTVANDRVGRGPQLFTARRLVKRTGVEILIRAMSYVIGEEPGTRLVIAGDGPLRPQLQNLVRELGLENHIEFVGRVSEDELLRLYRSADVAVTPTLSLEGFGLSTAEAMASGTVPIVTPIGANPEVVSKVSTKLVARGTDPEQLGTAILALWKSADFPDIENKVRAAVHPDMSWPVVASKYVDVYEQSRS